MLEQLKAFGEAAKKFVLWIGIPFAAIVAYILYIRDLNKELRGEVSKAEEKAKLGETLVKLEEAKDEAKKTSEDWEAIRGHYFSNPDDNGDNKGDS